MSNEKKEPRTDERVMGAVSKALRSTGHGDLVEEYFRKATSGDYENLLKVSGEYVNIERV